MNRKRSIGKWACLAGLGVLAGCGGSKPTPVIQAPKVVPSPKPAVAIAAPRTLRLIPSKVLLAPGDPGVQMIVEETTPRGGIRDWTGEVAWSVDPPGILSVGPGGYVRPLKPGTATVKAAGKGEGLGTRVVVTDSAREGDFASDIVPVLTRSGCNTGGCHGKADGQNGLHLSLFGYDPEADFRSLARDAGGRRVLAFRPEDSLLLCKATGEIPHGGGQRIAPGSEEYKLLRDWIASGARETTGKGHGPVVRVAVEPTDTRLDEPGPRQLRVTAIFADGHERDVTRLANYKVNDDSAVEVDDRGKARLLRRAEADLIVRFQSMVVSTRLATLINPDLKYDFAALDRKNLVDRELFRRLESLKVPPSPAAGDATFLRRVSLDLTGEQPDSATVKEFLKDTDPDKRAKVVDELLKSREFAQFWQIKLGDMLQISQARFGNGAGWYEEWVKQQIQKNTPWDAVVRELLTSLGDPTVRGGGPANYAIDGIDPKVAAEQTAQRFLGLRLRCAQCHDHPFDVWTQDDYFGLAAIFAKVSRGAPMAPGAMATRAKVAIDPKGTLEHLRTKKPAEMRLLDRSPVKAQGKEDPRKELADWITRPENPFFARAMANWTWAQFFGKGLADPADDLSRSNPPVHPELLDALARSFVEGKYDLRALIRTIATSEAYGLSSATVPGNAQDTRLFSHQLPRPLTAHQMADALSQVTGTKLSFGPLREQKRAIEVSEPSVASTLLDTFGRCPRTVGCSPVATPALSLRQSLLLIGGPEVDSRVSSLNGYLSALLRDGISPEDLVPLLYYKTLCRPPTDEELSHWTAELKSASSLGDAAEDFFWALLNSREFAFNH